MRVLLTAHPGWGHLHPVLGLARALREAGHEVLVATAARMAAEVRDRGVPAVAAGPDWSMSGDEPRARALRAARALGQVRLLVEPADEMLADLTEVARRWAPDLVVRDSFELAGMVLARRRGVPLVVVGVTARLPDALLLRSLGRLVRSLRERHGLPAEPLLDDLHGDLWLSPMPPSFDAMGCEPLPQERHVRPLAVDRVGSDQLPAALEALPRPLVLCTLGTVFNAHPELLVRAAHAASSLGAGVVLTTGRGNAPEALPALPPGAWATEYVPQSLLMGQVAAAVTHGGFSTVMAALAAGVPLCCVPLASDQPVNAQRVVQLGAGTACTTWTPEGGFPLARPHDVTVHALREALRRVLREPGPAAGARVVRDEIAALPDVSDVVRLVESLGA